MSITRERTIQMAKLLEDQSKSGLSKKDFCIQRGIKPATFYYWQKKLGDSTDAMDDSPAIFHRLPIRVEEHEVSLQLADGAWLNLRSSSIETLGSIVQSLIQAHA